jgi:hypothetical protein
LLSLFELAKSRHAVADRGDLLFVEAACLIAAIACDERDRIAIVQQRDSPRDGIMVQS